MHRNHTPREMARTFARSLAMRSVYVLVGTFCAMTLVGCSEDPNDAWIAETISTLKGTTSVIEQVSKTVGDALAQAKRDGKPLALEKIAKATEESGELKKRAEKLQKIKAEAEYRKDNITKEQRDDYAIKHKGAFQASMVELDSAQKKLDTVLREAEVYASEGAMANAESKGALEKLREKLKEGQDEFEVLTKRQA
jgi:hypothetical protein